LKPIDLSLSPASKLDVKIQSLIAFLCDTTIMRKNLQYYGIDKSIARLHKRHLIDALNVLNEAQKELDQFEKKDISPTEKKQILDRIFKLTSKFYQLVPHKKFRNRAIPALTSSDVTQKRKMLEDLIDLQLTSRIILASTVKARTMNPLDYIYNAIKTDITPIDVQGAEFDILAKYINRHSQYQILNLFRVCREAEQERFKAHLDKSNRMLLFHGSSATNFLSILSQGLKIAPPEAPASGYAFGKGIYTADCLTKSIGYCHPHLSDNVVCVLLCEVALGKTFDTYDTVYMEKPMDGYQSTKGLGRQAPEPSGNFITFDNMIIPLGEIITNQDQAARYRLSWNEYIVYDESQVRIRYIAHIKVQ
jgi:hypothetical protein